MKSYNAQRISRTSASTADNPGVVKWRISAGWIESGAVVNEEGNIFFGSENFNIYCLFPNGTLNWVYETGDPIYSVPAIVADGTIYIASCDHFLYALRPDGTLKWRFNTGEIVSASPVIAPDGTIYIGHSQGRVFAISPNGTEQWHYDCTQDIYGSVALGHDGTIYIGSWDNDLYALNPNGTLQWRFHTGNHVKGISSIAPDGTIYFGSWDGYLYALNHNGTQKWRCRVGSGTETTPAIADDGTIYVGGDDLYAVYPNGTIRWVFSLGSNRHIFQSCPALSAEGTIYVGVDIGSDNGGEMLAVNPNGTEHWRQRIADYRVESSPAIGADGTVYIGCNYNMPLGYLYAFGRGPLNAYANGPYTGHFGESIQFTGNAFGGTPPYTYHWDFGDGQTSTQQSPSHTYTTVGNLTATLTVTDSVGNSSSDNAAVTITYAQPTVMITRPVGGLYLMNLRILPLDHPFIFGPITVEAQASQIPFGIDRVEFTLDGQLMATDTSPPYRWTWTQFSFGKHTIRAIAYDTTGNWSSTALVVNKFF